MDVQQSRRERKRARTRDAVLCAAQRLFFEQGYDRTTIEDVARAADVAVQTVFNHVASKEELFFADRTPYADAILVPVVPAPGQTCAEALVELMTGATVGYLASLQDPVLLDMTAQIEATPALTRYERAILTRTETGLAASLCAAGLTRRPQWTAALLLATTRVVSIEHRQRILVGLGDGETVSELAADLRRDLHVVLDATARGVRQVQPA